MASSCSESVSLSSNLIVYSRLIFGNSEELGQLVYDRKIRHRYTGCKLQGNGVTPSSGMKYGRLAAFSD